VSARSIRRSRARHEARRIRRRRAAGIAAGAAIGGSALLASGAQAANFPVTNTNNAGANSLRAAITSANASGGADTISFSGAGASGEIVLATDIPISDDLTINGPGSGALAVSGDSNNDNVRDFATSNVALGDTRIFTITDPTSPGAPRQVVSISGLTLKEGVADFFTGGLPQHESGGAIRSQDTTLNLSNVMFTDNVATNAGGAVAFYGASSPSYGGRMTIANAQFTGNRARSEGGAIASRPVKYGDEVGTTITNTQITGNRAGGTDFGAFGYSGFPEGGGLTLRYESSLDGVTITGNTALTNNAGAISGYGGGAYMPQGGRLSNSIVSGNISGNEGGGLSAGALRIRNTAITGNTAANGGGGMVAFQGGGKYGPSGPNRLDNSTVSGNSVTSTAPFDGRGGGISVYGNGLDETLVLRNSTVAANSASQIGGGLITYTEDDLEEPLVRMRSTIIADNTAPVGVDAISQVDGGSAPIEDPGGIVAGFSLIENPAAGSGPLEDPIGTNLLGVDPKLGPLAANGGPTQTHALSPTSAAVDSGIANGFATDQRGQPRTVDAVATNSPFTDGTDIGAFELADPAASGDDPDTAFVKKPKKKVKLKEGKQTAKVKLKFTGTDNAPPVGPLTFECKVDKGKFEECKSPLKLKLDKGKHTVEVRAIDETDAVDATPAKAKIKVKKAKPKK
jgi:predicted outer membrane repeat protein